MEREVSRASPSTDSPGRGRELSSVFFSRLFSSCFAWRFLLWTRCDDEFQELALRFPFGLQEQPFDVLLAQVRSEDARGGQSSRFKSAQRGSVEIAGRHSPPGAAATRRLDPG